jgi:arylsulfatase A-like enzyme
VSAWRPVVGGAILGALAGACVAGVEIAREAYLANGLRWLALDVVVASTARLLVVGAGLGAASALAARSGGTDRSGRLRAVSVAAAGVFAVGAWLGLGDTPWLRYAAENSLAARALHALLLGALALAASAALWLVARLPSRALVVGVAGVLLVLSGAALGALLRERPPGPNLLLISIDTLRADRLGCYGYPVARTSNIDGLAAGGTLYETVIASAPVTLPAMATLLTGLDPPAHGARYNGFYRVRRPPVTLAELLADRGYRTGAAVANFALDSSFGIAQGFASFDDAMTQFMAPPGYQLPVEEEDGTWWRRFRSTQPAQRPASEITDAGLAWLERHGDEPFFLWLHYMDPHSPYEPPPEYRIPGRQAYDGEVAYVDAEIGRLLAGYRARFPDARTLIVVVADHGESLGEHGIQGHVYALYEQAIRVPLILNLPGRVPAGKRVSEPLRARDVPLEILRALGLPDAGPFGEQAAHAAGDDEEWWAYTESFEPRIGRGEEPLRSVRTARFKYIDRGEPEELYDLALDPAEERNLATEAPETARPLRARLDLADPEAPDAPMPADAATVERLRALGYVE